MLVLTRKTDESVVIGNSTGLQETVRITVLSVDRGEVRLGFDLSPNIPVHREEVWTRLKNKQRGGGAMPMISNPQQRRPFHR